MQLIYLFILAGALIICGIFYLLKGLRNNLDEDKIVPIADIKEIQEYKKAHIAIHEPSVVSASIAEHIIKENVELKTQLAVQEKSGVYESDLKNLRDRVDQLQAENAQVREALAREVSSKGASARQADSDEQRSEILRLKESNERLTTENLRITRLWEEDKRKIEQSEAVAQELKKQLGQMTSQDHLRIQALEEQLDKFNKEQGAAAHAKQVLDRLSAENQDLLFQIREKEAALDRSRSERERIVADYESRIKSLNERMDELYKKLSSEDMDALNIKNFELDNKNNHLLVAKNALEEETATLKAELKNLKEMQAIMQEKETFLQYELTKTRAQLLGLERLCEDFKVQIESAHG